MELLEEVVKELGEIRKDLEILNLRVNSDISTRIFTKKMLWAMLAVSIVTLLLSCTILWCILLRVTEIYTLIS